ncbi:efflux transporter outer membrane subunit [Kamptonema cortianum]|nr:efflux transporter outer membrane subunit [Kamptonema cortianum]
MRNLLTMLALCSLAAGCALPEKQPPSSPVAAPSGWPAGKKNNSGEVQTGWLETFKDKRLDSLVDEAIAKNFDLQATAARLESARAGAQIAGAPLYPQAGFGANAGRADNPWAGGNNASESYGMSLNVSWELDIWGRLRGARAAATADATAAQFDYDGARLSLAGQTSKAWFALIESLLQVQIAEDDVKSVRQTFELTEERLRFGAQSEFDVKLSGASLKAAENNLVQRRENLERAKRDLETILSRFPSGAIEGAPALPALAARVPAGIPSTLLLRRPDLRSAEWRYFASENRVFSAEAERLPRISLTSSLGTSSDALRSLFDAQAGAFNLAANLAQPVLEGGRISGQIAQAQARRKEVAAQYSKLVLDAFKEVEIALVRESSLAQREILQAESYRLLQEAYALAEEQYKSGQTDIVSLLEAQRNMLSSRSALLATQRARLENRVDLHLALGGDFSAPASSPTVLPSSVTPKKTSPLPSPRR